LIRGLLSPLFSLEKYSISGVIEILFEGVITLLVGVHMPLLAPGPIKVLKPIGAAKL